MEKGEEEKKEATNSESARFAGARLRERPRCARKVHARAPEKSEKRRSDQLGASGYTSFTPHRVRDSGAVRLKDGSYMDSDQPWLSPRDYASLSNSGE